MNFATLKSLTIPEGVVTKIESGGKVLWELAALYLYGTPSESGNIGLRSGGTVTYYKGAVLPNIDTVYTDEDKAKYPYALIHHREEGTFAGEAYPEEYMLLFSNVPFDGNEASVSFQVSALFKKWDCLAPEFATWEFDDEGEMLISKYDNVEWTNRDIYMGDYDSELGEYVFTDEICVVASGSIPVTGIVDYDGDIPIYGIKE